MTGDFYDKCFKASFVYGGEKYFYPGDGRLLFLKEDTDTGRNSVIRNTYFRLDGTGITLRVRNEYYEGYGALEQTLYFTNEGSKDSEILEEARGTEISFAGKGIVLYGMKGDIGKQFASYENDLSEKMTVINRCGRPTHFTGQYFSLVSEGTGFNIAVSWQGCFRAEFEKKTCENEENVGFYDCQDRLHTYLKPGETVRTPMTLVQKFDGTREDGINEWRRFYYACIMPEGWKPLVTASTSWYYDCMARCDEASQIDAIDGYGRHGVDLDYWWMDAGWYLSPHLDDTDKALSFCLDSGNYNVDTERFPTEFKAVSEHMEKLGRRGTILWFEPEIFRASFENMKKIYPEFKEEWTLGESSCLYDIGKPEVVDFLAKNILKVLRKGKITVYRQDFNTDPAPWWAANDGSEDRAGITENKYCVGYLALWDRLLEEIPGLLIDNCASGGGRLDLESLKRSVPLHRTDFNTETSHVTQSMTMSLNEWVPFSGGPSNIRLETKADKYLIRSVFSQSVTLNFDYKNPSFDWEKLSGLVRELRMVQKYSMKNYYRLSDWSSAITDWAAWEYVDPIKCEGVIQAFRRSMAEEDTLTVYPRGISDDATYWLCDCESGRKIMMSGREINEKGYEIKLPGIQSATTVFFGKEPVEIPDYGNVPDVRPVYDFEDAPEGAIQLSDLKWKYWRMFGANSDDSEPAYVPSRDSDEFGGILSIGTKSFKKGIRIHPDAESGTAVIDIDIEKYGRSVFSATVGKETNMGLSGKIQFHVELDSVRIASSPILEPREAYVMKADVTGGKILRLVVTDGGDGIGCDSAGWGNAVLI